MRGPWPEKTLKTLDLVKVVAHLRHIAHGYEKSRDDSSCTGWHLCKKALTEEGLIKAEHVVIRCVQHEEYAKEIKCLHAKQDFPSNSSLRKLNPIIDSDGLVRVGGRLSKRWVVLFTCLSTRAVHIEIIESLNSSSFINALCRFFAIRGPAKQLKSDCGTNFVCASKELKLDHLHPGEASVEDYLLSQRCQWVFFRPITERILLLSRED